MTIGLDEASIAALNASGLTHVTCHCGIAFSIPTSLYHSRKVDGQQFYCPLGHSCVYRPGKTEAQKLREQLDAERARSEYWRAEEQRRTKERAAARAEATRLRNRAKAGACPCCNRSFVGLARHLKTQHPDFKADQS